MPPSRPIALALLVLLVLAGACGEEAEAPAPTVRPEADPPAPTAPEAPPPDDPTVRSPLTLPSTESPPEPLRTFTIERSRVKWFDVGLEDDVARRRVRAAARSLARVWGRQAGTAYLETLRGSETSARDGCEPVLAHPRLVSMICVTRYLPDRAYGIRSRTRGVQLAVDGTRVYPVTLEDALTDEGLEAVRREAATRALRRMAANHEGDLPDLEEWLGLEAVRRDLASMVAGPTGIAAHFDDELEEGGEPIRVTVPYARIREHVREDGWLAWVFGDGPAPAIAAALPEERGEDESEPREEVSGEGFGLGDPAPVAELAARWSGLPGADRSAVVIVPLGASIGRLVLPSDDAARAGTLASSLFEGGVAERWRWTLPPVTPRLSQTSDDLNLRARRFQQAPIEGVLPAGAIVGAIEGFLPGLGASEARGRGNWAFVAAGLDDAGWVGSGILGDHEGCVPPADRFLSEIDDAQRAQAAARLRRAVVSIRNGGAASEHALFVTRAGVSTHAALHRLSEGCGVGDAVLSVQLPGSPFDVRVTHSEARGGHSILVLGTRLGDERERYAAYRPGRAQPLWQHTFAPPATGEGWERVTTRVTTRVDEQGRWFPVQYEDGEELVRLTWDDGELVVSAEP